MISFNTETAFELQDEALFTDWISQALEDEEKSEGEINYIFCDDEYLYEMNVKYLNHDTYTDVISFDYSIGNEIHGDIYISIDRVVENAKEFNSEFINELQRVMIHGILHFCGYKDKSEDEAKLMRHKEDFYLAKLN
ncbi:rRNA maturation RNase YbeY [Sediminibacter sp. Hel_I_10]|uniref:rRNA maturation RNase YbeY n=1 Tax=Sediminibacter sp. Hel_I_10 TaxID=1392490 RepID=UPI00047CC0B7|nr:rRNA maturation RNase YbeY [Sediminibacter sp. Hel_I_10]